MSSDYSRAHRCLPASKIVGPEPATRVVVIVHSPTLAPAASRAEQARLADRVDHLDGWRGLAILLVLQSHFLPMAGLDTGQLGVDIFFCLSGLLMSNLLFVKRVPLTQFYKRRISRILPAFVMFVAVVYGVAAWSGQGKGWNEIIPTLFFLRTYIPAQPDIWNTGLPIGHLWSLNVEEHSYVLLSLITLIPFLRRREAWLLGAISAVVMALYYFYETSPRFAHTSFEIRTEIASSFLLVSAAYFLVRHHVTPYVPSWLPLVALAVAVPGYSPTAHWWLSAIVSPLALAFCVNHLDLTHATVRRVLT